VIPDPPKLEVLRTPADLWVPLSTLEASSPFMVGSIHDVRICRYPDPLDDHVTPMEPPFLVSGDLFGENFFGAIS